MGIINLMDRIDQCLGGRVAGRTDDDHLPAGVVVGAAAMMPGVGVADGECTVGEGSMGYGRPRSAGIALAVMPQGLSVTYAV